MNCKSDSEGKKIFNLQWTVDKTKEMQQFSKFYSEPQLQNVKKTRLNIHIMQTAVTRVAVGMLD